MPATTTTIWPTLMAHDSDAFTRWDAGQRLAGNVLLALVRDHAAGRPARARSTRAWSRRSPPASIARPRIRPSPPARCRCPAAAISASRWPVIDVEGIAPRARPCPRRARHARCATAGSPPTMRIPRPTDRSRSRPRPWAGVAQEPGPGLSGAGRRSRRAATARRQFARGRQHDRQPRGAARCSPRPACPSAMQALAELLRRAGSTSRWS